MASFAQCTLVGNLGRDPEMRTMADGSQVASFSLATNRKRKDGEIVTWWRCSLFGTRAAVLAKYAVKGDPILVTGEPMNREWTDKDGATRMTLEVVVSDFQFMGSRDTGQGAANQSPQDQQPKRASRPYPNGTGDRRPTAPPAGDQGGLPFDDQIPFGPYLNHHEYAA